MPIFLDGLGTVQASNTIAIRTQTNGTLQSVNFIEGQQVKKGDILAVIDPRRNELAIINAGHMPPLLRRIDGSVDTLGSEETGLPLGIDADYPYELSTSPIQRSECLVAFTEGFSEAMNAAGELYGMDRLHTQVGASGVEVKQLARHIVDDVRQFVGGHPQSDDMCLACFGRLG